MKERGLHVVRALRHTPRVDKVALGDRINITNRPILKRVREGERDYHVAIQRGEPRGQILARYRLSHLQIASRYHLIAWSAGNRSGRMYSKVGAYFV